MINSCIINSRARLVVVSNAALLLLNGGVCSPEEQKIS